MQIDRDQQQINIKLNKYELVRLVHLATKGYYYFNKVNPDSRICDVLDDLLKQFELLKQTKNPSTN